MKPYSKVIKIFLQHLMDRWTKLVISLVFILGLSGSLFAWLVQAEGSRTLYPAGSTGFRANIEWRTSFYGSFLRRRALFKVYAEAGEVILLGSSAVGVGMGDISIYMPGRVDGSIGDETIPANPDFSCEDQRNASGNADQGRITSRLQELAGPDTITDTGTAAPGLDVPNGFVPCFYDIPEEGIYHVVFYGPAGANSDAEIPPTGEIDLNSPANFDATQTTSISAWDVTVRNSLTATEDINGRLFADYLALFTGSNPRPMSSTHYVLTTDGLIYKTELNGLDPNGFIVYANSVGFRDSDGSTPLYRDVVADPSISFQEQNQLNELLGGVSLALPSHRIFFSQPTDEAILANGIPLTPVVPEIESIRFDGNLESNNSSVGAGGTFVYTTNVASIYELIISRDGIDFDPTSPPNRVLRGDLPAGRQQIVWDGLDNAGTPFPVGTYPVSITIRQGEYHFPLLDIENSLGGPQYELINPPAGACPSFYNSPASCFTAFYDDRGYTAANGTDVGLPGAPLPGAIPPDPPRSDPLTGYDTTTDQRKFGDGSLAGFGDKKGLDLWTFYPSEPKETTLNIVDFNLIINKTDNELTAVPGGTVTYTLTFTNTGPANTTGTVITETVPDHSRFEAPASTAGWSCPDQSPAGAICTFTIGDLAAGDNGSISFAVTVDDPIPAGVTEILNTVIIGDDGSHGPEPPVDNIDTETTPLEPSPIIPPPTVTSTSTSTPTSSPDGGDDATATPVPGTPGATVAAGPSAAVTPAELPVAFLPETGSRTTGETSRLNVSLIIAAIAALGISLTILLNRSRLNEIIIRLIDNPPKK